MKARCIILGLLVCWCGYADDWPQWRGANRDGHSSETLQVHGLGGGPRILWRAAVGTGFSAISISQNRVYTMGNANDSDTIWCLDAIKGSVLWKKTYPAKLGAVYYEGGPGSTPTVHERKVYTISKWGKIFCLDALTGTEVWNHDLAQEGIKSNR